MLNRILMQANDLPDAWFQAVYAALDKGREFKIDCGSYAGQTRLELDWVDIHILKPGLRCTDGLPLIPEMPEGSTLPAPVTKEYVRQYAPYLMTAEKRPGEQYTYGERLNAASVIRKWKDGIAYCGLINQIEHIIETYKEHGPRNNQMVLQVAQPGDLLLSDPPCLRSIDTRIQDGKLHFFPYFRSWDLWGGFPANLAGISMLQEYMAGEIGVAQGEMICSSKGLHLYGYAVQFAEMRAMKQAKARAGDLVMPKDEDPDPTMYVNYYKCPRCKEKWQDFWDCACDDRCPACGLSVSPYEILETEPCLKEKDI